MASGEPGLRVGSWWLQGNRTKRTESAGEVTQASAFSFCARTLHGVGAEQTQTDWVGCFRPIGLGCSWEAARNIWKTDDYSCTSQRPRAAQTKFHMCTKDRQPSAHLAVSGFCSAVSWAEGIVLFGLYVNAFRIFRQACPCYLLHSESKSHPEAHSAYGLCWLVVFPQRLPFVLWARHWTTVTVPSSSCAAKLIPYHSYRRSLSPNRTNNTNEHMSLCFFSKWESGMKTADGSGSREAAVTHPIQNIVNTAWTHTFTNIKV